MDSSQILREAGMSSRAPYYSGRGATTSDLDASKLEKIHTLIKEHHGEDAAEAFVDMVEDMPNMNATDFINNLGTLEWNNWKWQKQTAKENGHDIPKDEDGNYNTTIGMMSIYSAMANGKRDETPRIKQPFLRRMGRKIDYRDSYGHSIIWF